MPVSPAATASATRARRAARREDAPGRASLAAARSRSSAEVKALAGEHLKELEERIADLQAMHASLAQLADCCQGDHRPDCPIINSLASPC